MQEMKASAMTEDIPEDFSLPPSPTGEGRMGRSELDISLGASIATSSIDSTKTDTMQALLAGASQFKPGFESDRRKSGMMQSTASGVSSLGGSMSSIGFQSETMQQVLAGADQFQAEYEKEKAIEAAKAKAIEDKRIKAEMIAVVEAEEEKRVQAQRQAAKAQAEAQRLEQIAEEARQIAEAESRGLAQAEAQKR